MPEKKSSPKSARESAGLRGLVWQCTEERTTAASPGFPEIKFSSTTEYDREGRILSSSHINSDGSKWTAMSFSLAGLDLYHPVPHGGMAKTLYDESDRPIETRVYDAEGHIIQRLLQSYNAAGQILETKVVLEDIATLLPAELKTQLLAEPGAAEELKQQLAALLGAQREMFKTSYVYDAEGQLSEKRDHLGYGQETVTKFVYDSYGNKVEEHAITSGDANPPQSEPDSQDASAASSPHESEVTYIYKYDSHGNWIEQVVRSRSQPAGPQGDSTLSRRAIAYY